MIDLSRQETPTARSTYIVLWRMLVAAGLVRSTIWILVHTFAARRRPNGNRHLTPAAS